MSEFNRNKGVPMGLDSFGTSFLKPLFKGYAAIFAFFIVDDEFESWLSALIKNEYLAVWITSRLVRLMICVLIIHTFWTGGKYMKIINNKYKLAVENELNLLNLQSTITSKYMSLGAYLANLDTYHQPEVFYRDIEYDSTALMNRIAEFLTHRFKHSIQTCIKMFDSSSLKAMLQTGNIADCRVFTLVRGGSDLSKRREEELARHIKKYGIPKQGDPFTPESVGLISDFYTMMLANKYHETCESDRAKCFASYDMVRYRNRIDLFNSAWLSDYPKSGMQFHRPYRTTSGEWWKHYKSTVCVPIRIPIGEQLHPSWRACLDRKHWTGDYLVVGFFCIDHCAELPKHIMPDLIKYVEKFADIFSGYFQNVSVGAMDIIGKNKVYTPNEEPSTVVQQEREKGKDVDMRLIKFIRLIAAFSPAKAKAYQEKKLAEFANVAPDSMDETDLFYRFLRMDAEAATVQSEKDQQKKTN